MTFMLSRSMRMAQRALNRPDTVHRIGRSGDGTPGHLRVIDIS